MTPPRASTGTGAQRRRLTLAEALAGALPDPYTGDEWRALHEGSARQVDDFGCHICGRTDYSRDEVGCDGDTWTLCSHCDSWTSHPAKEVSA